MNLLAHQKRGGMPTFNFRSRMPALFFGHGNPMNALSHNAYTEAWRAIGAQFSTHIPKPKAILMISAHWYQPGVALTAMEKPPTIHDFGGFPRELFEVQYPAPGDPALAERIVRLLQPLDVRLDEKWGLDHGTWSVLMHVFPAADIPVVQLSLDLSQSAHAHYALARRLTPLRDEGVLILGSGNLVHNLRTYAWGKHSVEPYDWALRFENEVRALLLAGKHGPLLDYENHETLRQDARLAVPTPEHYLPLLYVIAQQQDGEAIDFPIEGIDGGSISMLAVRVG